MFLLGTLVNGLLIVIGTLLGKLLNRIPEGMKITVMYAIGLSVMVLGLQMGLKSENFLIVIISLVVGAVAGEALKLEDKLNDLGLWLEQKVGIQQWEREHFRRVCYSYAHLCDWGNGDYWSTG